MVLTNRNILLISPEPWDHFFVSKHHYAVTLAKKGNTVFFLNPPSGKNICSTTPYPDLFTIDYRAMLRGLNRMPRAIARRASALEIRRIVNLSKTEFDVVWSFDPFRFQFLDLFKAPLNIYYAADWHACRTNEIVAADHAQLVLSPSRLILDALSTKTKKMFLNHAVAEYFFESNEKMKLPGNNATKVGYVGNLQSKFLHYALLKKIVDKNPHCDFIFVGNEGNGAMKGVREFQNVFFPGPLINAKVPSFLKACDILLLCYDTDKYRVEASNSHKIMEYLASGKTIVSTPISEYANLPHVIVVPNDANEIPSLLTRVSKNLDKYNTVVLQTNRINFAKAHTYDNQINRIEKVLMEESLI